MFRELRVLQVLKVQKEIKVAPVRRVIMGRMALKALLAQKEIQEGLREPLVRRVPLARMGQMEQMGPKVLLEHKEIQGVRREMQVLLELRVLQVLLVLKAEAAQ